VSLSSTPEIPLHRREYLFLLAGALLVAAVIAALQPVPGYMDADYYYAGGMQLAGGHGFTESIIWNYLDNPQGLPHPSHSYWYPLASMIAAGGMLLTGKIDFLSARIGFILMAALAPLAVAALAYRITRKRQLALFSGILAIFSGFYLPFIVTTDNYSLYMLVGALYFLMLDRLTLRKTILLGVLAGLMNLARGDGLLWLPLTLLAVTVLTYRQAQAVSLRARILRSVSNGLLALLGYLLVMGAWMARSLVVFGTLLPPGSGHLLWMTSYNQLFSFTPGAYTFQSWLANGLPSALQARAGAIWQNLNTGLVAQGLLILVPLIMVGAWKNRHLFIVQLGVFGWIMMFLAESLLFPFASVRGGFFHAGTAFQPLWFALAPFGLDAWLARVFRNKRAPGPIPTLFQLTLVVIVIVFSGILVKMRVIDQGWNEGEYLYQKADRILVEQGARPDEVVMARNPPAYFIMTGRQAIVTPYGDVQSLLRAAQKFNARYVILEQNGIPLPLEDLYEHPENYPEFVFLGALGDNHILLIKPSP
jgi:hypothetical protein